MTDKSKYIAEFFGTFILIFAGCGAIVANNAFDGALGHSGVALAWGLVVMVLIYSIGNVSGAHMNSAVTLTFWLSKDFEGRLVPGYLISQVLGAIAGAGFLKLMFPEDPTLGATLPNAGLWQTFLMEVLLSFILMFVIFNVSTAHMEKGIMAGVAVGGTVGLDAMFGGPMTGASMNPARSMGPALVSGNLGDLWIYILAPVVGMFAAYPVSRIIQADAGKENPNEAA
ncbi:MAG: MIP/aquaporin family protein [Opitutales bacterium]